MSVPPPLGLKVAVSVVINSSSFSTTGSTSEQAENRVATNNTKAKFA